MQIAPQRQEVEWMCGRMMMWMWSIRYTYKQAFTQQTHLYFFNAAYTIHTHMDDEYNILGTILKQNMKRHVIVV